MVRTSWEGARLSMPSFRCGAAMLRELLTSPTSSLQGVLVPPSWVSCDNLATHWNWPLSVGSLLFLPPPHSTQHPGCSPLHSRPVLYERVLYALPPPTRTRGPSTQTPGDLVFR